MLQSLLIANRGEIACRIIRTARAMGIRTIAVHSDADAHARHVRLADEAVHIGASSPPESYLRGDRIIAAALDRGAEAIHPGYGFLSENGDFAQGVIDAGLIWIGPEPASIRAMGRKDAAKRLMQDAGVPVTPGYLGEDQSPARLHAAAAAIGWPVLIKAVAGGGGKGMRRVDDAEQFAAALEACRREAASAFGDDRVLLEKYIRSPRHIEVQLFGDRHGNLVHLFERDCSIQRRHQKIIEEAPAPGMDEATRGWLCDTAVRAGRAVEYVGAGTVEFIADASDGLRANRIWFMEMNTRLQVEHPVTEAITGVDLVEWQIRVASGEPLPMAQDGLSIRGHAIEARLCAEDPADGFRPSVGPLDHFVVPPTARIDSGVEQGDASSRFYDPMLAKIIAHAASREQAIQALAATCGGIEVWPVRTNAGLLHRLLRHPRFARGPVDTGFVEAAGDMLALSSVQRVAMLAQAAIGLVRPDDTGRGAPRSDASGDVWTARTGFRLNAADDPFVFVDGGGGLERVSLPPGWQRRAVTALPVPGGIVVFDEGEALFARTDAGARAVGGSVGDGVIVAPMPGRITAVGVAMGARVTSGQMLVTLEAMKMEQALIAPFDGVVAALGVVVGAQVDEGAMLVRIDKEG